MRRQYHFQPSKNGRAAWDVHRLILAAADLPVVEVPVSDFESVLDTVYWFDEAHPPTIREVLDHTRLIAAADLRFPVILGADGRVMDGMHRICRALADGHETVLARRFPIDPEPDHIDVQPDELDYSDVDVELPPAPPAS